MKILITGSKGQVASQLIDIINKGKSELGQIPIEVMKAEVIGLTSSDLDISDLNKVKKVINEIKPQVVINSAAYTNVDGAETNKELAFKVNALGARNLAMGCEEIGAKLIHISTDFVFRGKEEPLKDCDITNPQSIYDKSKDMGEKFVREFCSRYFIVRPAWVYGYNGKNFVYAIMKAAKERGEIKVVNDQVGNPTNVEDLVHHILKLIVTEEYGVYNCVGNGVCSRYEFACKIVEFAEIECTVNPCTSEEFPAPADRPKYSALDNMALRCTVGGEMRPWEEALKSFIQESYQSMKIEEYMQKD